MTDPNHGVDFAIGLEIFPRARRSSADHELEPEAAGVPWLVRKGAFLVLSIECTDGGEFDLVVPVQHGHVVAEQRGLDRSDRKDGDSDHGTGLDAHVRLHCCRRMS